MDDEPRKERYCPGCGYDLRGERTAVASRWVRCPECGRVTVAAKLATRPPPGPIVAFFGRQVRRACVVGLGLLGTLVIALFLLALVSGG